MNVGSLFSGVGGFDLGFELHGFTVSWQCEIDKHAREVLARHWPDVPCYEDVAAMRGDAVEPVDIITAGFPCQDMSVAGTRLGFNGERSILFFEIVRIAREMHQATNGTFPRFLVLENVPGLLSSRNGSDIKAVMDTLESAGYVVDCDIIDSQYYGVPQRRKRVFIVCQSVEDLLRTRTTTSALTIAQALMEILHASFREVKARSIIAPKSSDWSKSISVDGLNRRMRLFGLPTKNDLLGSLLAKWDDESQKSSADCIRWDWESGAKSDAALTTEPDTSFDKENGSQSLTAKKLSYSNTEQSWKTFLDDLCALVRSCITSTETSPTTDQTIYSCVLMSERIAQLICQLKGSSPAYWSAASSALTAMEEFTNYARQASNSLFTPVERLQSWANFAERAALLQFVVADFRGRRAGEILALTPSGSGDTAASGATGEDTATRPVAGVGAVGLRSVAKPLGSPNGRGYSNDVDFNAFVIASSDTARSSYDRGDGSETLVVASTLTSSHRKQGWRGDGSDNQIVAPVDFQNVTSKVNRTRVEYGSPANTLHQQPQSVVFQQNQRDEVRLIGGDGQTAGSLTAESGMHNQNFLAVPIREAWGRSDAYLPPDAGIGEPGDPMATLRSHKQHAVGLSTGIRRLTPTEAERLQGFPDGWTLPHSDTHRYRMLGNAVTVNVAAAIAANVRRAFPDGQP